MGDQVVGEGSQLVEIPERPQPVAAERQGQVRDGELGALEERHIEPAVARRVPEEAHRDQDADELLGRPPGRDHEPREAPGKPPLHELPQVVEGGGEQPHELRDRRFGRILVEDHGAVLGRDGREGLRGERAVLPVEAGQVGGHREVPGAARQLREVGEVAGAEVDAVELQEERRRVLGRPEEVGLRIELGRLRLVERQRAGIVGSRSVRTRTHSAAAATRAHPARTRWLKLTPWPMPAPRRDPTNSPPPGQRHHRTARPCTPTLSGGSPCPGGEGQASVPLPVFVGAAFLPRPARPACTADPSEPTPPLPQRPICIVPPSSQTSHLTIYSLFQLGAPIAQLDRAPDYGSGGWGFESLSARQIRQQHRSGQPGRDAFPGHPPSHPRFEPLGVAAKELHVVGNDFSSISSRMPSHRTS